MTLRTILALTLWATASTHALAWLPQDAGLRIVVIAGEDSVNIIQQKTAVAPIVEVRDRNNLPVAGALVTFTIDGGGKVAAFAGAGPTFTVTTNAAGRAVAAAINPLSSGGFHIQVQAAFQGQTAAATIVQSNVVTAAQAAGASAGTTGSGGATGSGSGGSGAAGGAGGAGGGLSATTIGVVAGAVGGGALVAAKAVGGDAGPTSGNYSGPLSGQFISTITSPGATTCVITRNITGTMTMKIEQASGGGAITGTATMEGTDVVVAQTCAGEFVSVSFNRQAPVTGSGTAIEFRKESTNTGPGPSGSNATVTTTVVTAFTGTWSGGVVTGTLIVTDSSTIDGPTFPSRSTGTGTYPVTLR